MALLFPIYVKISIQAFIEPTELWLSEEKVPAFEKNLTPHLKVDTILRAVQEETQQVTHLHCLNI